MNTGEIEGRGASQPLSEGEVTALLALSAIQRRVMEQTSKRDAGSLRARLDAQVLDEYRREGHKSREMRIGDEVVGSCTVTVPKAKEIAPHEEFSIIDMEALLDYANEDFVLYCGNWLRENLSIPAENWFYETGEMPDGCEIVTSDGYSVQPDPYVTLRVDADKVAEALGASLPAAAFAAIEGEVA